MTRFSLILPICFVVASGCSLCDCQKVATETSATPVPVVKSEPAPIAEPKVVEPGTVVPRAPTNDDIRRLQRSLRDIGFDPGPADGIVGARTKAVFVRLHTACTELAPLLENLNLPIVEGQGSVEKSTGDTLPNREETKTIQTQLRRAGFNPGPADGIFGSKTQSSLRQFQSGCLMAKEFEGILDDSLLPTVTETAAAREPEALTSSSRSDAGAEQATVVQPARAREEIRTLQLRLRDAGFDPGPSDGIMGPKTRSALAQYEASQRDQKPKPTLTTSGGVRQY